MTLGEIRKRAVRCVRELLPGTTRTCLWFLKITVAVSFVTMLLQFLKVLPWVSSLLTPLFIHIGLPGEAALAFVTGYFVNCYSAVAVAMTVGLDIRQVTILMTMVLCAHNMIVETAVQKKTGSSVVLCVASRTLSAFILAFALNWILPGAEKMGGIAAASAAISETSITWEALWVAVMEWAGDTLPLAIRIVVMIFSLNILQGLLKEFGVMRIIARGFKPLMHTFGLSARCSFLWLIANIVGLAYGAAAMLEESRNDILTSSDIRKVNLHIGINHSNLEDLIIAAAIGAVWWVVLLSRMVMAMVLVWTERLVETVSGGRPASPDADEHLSVP